MLVANAPIWVHAAGPVVHADAAVCRNADTSLHLGLHLLTKEGPVQVVVAELGSVERGPGLVLGEDADRTESDLLLGLGHFIRVEKPLVGGPYRCDEVGYAPHQVVTQPGGMIVCGYRCRGYEAAYSNTRVW